MDLNVSLPKLLQIIGALYVRELLLREQIDALHADAAAAADDGPSDTVKT